MHIATTDDIPFPFDVFDPFSLNGHNCNDDAQMIAGELWTDYH